MSDAGELSAQQVELLRRTVCRGGTDDEVQLFVATAQRLRLDPFARHIFAVRRWDRDAQREVMQAQVSIDGFRAVADSTGKYAGQTHPQWCGADGEWRLVWLGDDPPAAARVGVHRIGFVEPLYRVARYESYVQLTRDKKTSQMRANAMWAKMPEVMLAKCAEALALRSAFPHELSGVYTPDEMGQADTPHPLDERHDEPTPTPAKPAQQAAAPAGRAVRFSMKWSDEWGGKPVRDAGPEEVGRYIVALEAVLSDDTKSASHEKVAKHLEEVRSVYEGALEEEARKARDAKVAEGLEKMFAEPAADSGNAAWGIE